MKRTKPIRYVAMNSFDPTPLLMTTDEQRAALRQRICAVAVSNMLAKYRADRDVASA